MLYPETKNRTFHSAKNYPSENSEMRAMTIASFRVAQNSKTLTTKVMDKTLLKYLMADSSSAFSHWKKKGRLIETASGYQLTDSGIEECRNSLDGKTRGFNTTEGKVHEWTNQMLQGGKDAERSKSLEF